MRLLIAAATLALHAQAVGAQGLPELSGPGECCALPARARPPLSGRAGAF